MDNFVLSTSMLFLSGSLIFILGFIGGWFFVRKSFLSKIQSNDETIKAAEMDASLHNERTRSYLDKIADLENQIKEHKQQITENETQLKNLIADNSGLKVGLEAEKNLANEKMALLQESKEQMQKEFSSLASKVMKNNADDFSKQQQENLSSILNPFKEQLGEFRKRVDHVYDSETRDRTSLINEIKNLKKLNQQITEEASNLTHALKGGRKTQGNWGEMILERVLEVSGLQKGREYETQKNLQSHEGNRYLPDVIIHLPEQKDIIVDAKVSLSAYERYCSSEDEKEKQQFLQEHLNAIKSHIDKLSSKKYDDLKGVNTLDFVIIFIPIEPAYLLAAEKDANLLSNALAKKIIVVSPTTLLATLRIIENVWRFERQNKNAEEIARQAGRLYDKFVGFSEDLEHIGNRLDQAYQSYEQAKNKLSTGKGNLVRSVDKLKMLGAKTSKSIDENLLENQPSDESSD